MNGRYLCLLTSVALSWIALAEPAFGATCGQTDPATNKPLKGTLTLDPKSVTNLSFKRHTTPAELSLVFAVSGCEIDKGDVPRPRIDVLPVPGLSQFPPTGRPQLQSVDTRDGSDLIVRLGVDPEWFDAGKYGGLVLVVGSYLAANSTPIAVSRSEDDSWKPISIGLVAALVGFLWLIGLKFLSRDKLQVSWPWLILVGGLAVAVGLYAAFISYWDQEVWTFDDNAKATAVAAFTRRIHGINCWRARHYLESTIKVHDSGGSDPSSGGSDPSSGGSDPSSGGSDPASVVEDQ